MQLDPKKSLKYDLTCEAVGRLASQKALVGEGGQTAVTKVNWGVVLVRCGAGAIGSSLSRQP